LNPSNPKHLSRLISSIDWSLQNLAPFCRTRLEIIKQYTGHKYGERGGTSDRVPINLIRQAALIYQRHLVSSSPAVMISTRRDQLRPAAKAMETWVNHRLKEIEIDSVLRSWVLDALFCIGIVKVGVCKYVQDFAQGLRHDYKAPFADVISLDDWVMDMNAQRFDAVAYAGHRFRMPLRVALEEKSFKNKDALKATPKRAYGPRGEERAENLSLGSSAGFEEDEAEDMVELWEIWLPRDNLMVTLPADEGSNIRNEVIRVVQYMGPEMGPFHLLNLGEVPDNIMPSSPLLDLMDLHDATNRIWRKVVNQALRQKFNLLVPGTNTDDGTRLTAAADGHAVRVDGAGQAQEVSSGGFAPAILTFAMECRNRFSQQAGNLDSLGGLGPQTETVGQEQIIKESSAKQMQDMQSRTLAGTKGIIESLIWHWWTDSDAVYETELPLPYGGKTPPVNIIPGGRPDLEAAYDGNTLAREGDWLELNFDIDPYSLQHATPSQRASVLQGMLTQLLMPAGQMLQQQNITVNWEQVIRKLAHYQNLPDIEEILMFSAPASDSEPLDEAPRMPASTSRTYTRINRPGGTTQGRDAAMMQTLLGAGVQDAGMAALKNGVG